jgi:hypothetical protein
LENNIKIRYLKDRKSPGFTKNLITAFKNEEKYFLYPEENGTISRYSLRVIEDVSEIEKIANSKIKSLEMLYFFIEKNDDCIILKQGNHNNFLSDTSDMAGSDKEKKSHKRKNSITELYSDEEFNDSADEKDITTNYSMKIDAESEKIMRSGDIFSYKNDIKSENNARNDNVKVESTILNLEKLSKLKSGNVNGIPVIIVNNGDQSQVSDISNLFIASNQSVKEVPISNSIKNLFSDSNALSTQNNEEKIYKDDDNSKINNSKDYYTDNGYIIKNNGVLKSRGNEENKNSYLTNAQCLCRPEKNCPYHSSTKSSAAKIRSSAANAKSNTETGTNKADPSIANTILPILLDSQEQSLNSILNLKENEILNPDEVTLEGSPCDVKSDVKPNKRTGEYEDQELANDIIRRELEKPEFIKNIKSAVHCNESTTAPALENNIKSADYNNESNTAPALESNNSEKMRFQYVNNEILSDLLKNLTPKTDSEKSSSNSKRKIENVEGTAPSVEYTNLNPTELSIEPEQLFIYNNYPTIRSRSSGLKDSTESSKAKKSTPCKTENTVCSESGTTIYAAQANPTQSILNEELNLPTAANQENLIKLRKKINSEDESTNPINIFKQPGQLDENFVISISLPEKTGFEIVLNQQNKNQVSPNGNIVIKREYLEIRI